MKKASICWLFLAGLAGAAPPPESVVDTSTSSTSVSFPGRWRIVGAAYEGRRFPQDGSSGRVALTADRMEVATSSLTLYFGYHLSPRTDRCGDAGEIEMLVGGRTLLPGIYRWDGRWLWLCWNYRKDRPLWFHSELESQKFLLILERQDNAPR